MPDAADTASRVQFFIKAQRRSRQVAVIAGLAFLLPSALLMAQNAAPDYTSWPLLQPRFPSTGGGGVMIEGYDPVVSNGTCTTDFQAVVPTGEIYRSEVVFDAVPTQGGILCTNGRWRAKDGSNAGTTPYEVFIKDGVRRGKP
jgi:hypothetical protein